MSIVVGVTILALCILFLSLGFSWGRRSGAAEASREWSTKVAKLQEERAARAQERLDRALDMRRLHSG